MVFAEVGTAFEVMVVGVGAAPSRQSPADHLVTTSPKELASLVPEIQTQLCRCYLQTDPWALLFSLPITHLNQYVTVYYSEIKTIMTSDRT